MSSTNISVLLSQVRDGRREALDELLPIVYGELRRLAEFYMNRERPDHTLQATALVHEAFLRLVGGETVEARDRAHFFRVAAQVMRRVLVDHARGRDREKRGAGMEKAALTEIGSLAALRPADVVALDEALDALAEFDQRKSRIVELRYFAGLSIEETALALEISPATVKREWTFARAWLQRRIEKQTY